MAIASWPDIRDREGGRWSCTWGLYYAFAFCRIGCLGLKGGVWEKLGLLLACT